MNFGHVMKLTGRMLRGGRRNPLLYAAFAIPFLYTLMLQLVFGAFWQQQPTLVAFEEGARPVLSVLEKNKAVDLVVAASADEVRRMVEEKKADVGVLFPQDLTEKLASDERARLTAYVSGESLAQNRAVALAAVVDALRQRSPRTPRINFTQKYVGEARALSITQMLLPFIIMVTVFFAAFLLPASMLIQERERKTLAALLVTPVTAPDILAAYGLAGTLLALLMGIVALVFNQGWTEPGLLLVVLTLGALLMAEWGLAAGLTLKDTATLFANMKLFGILLYGPALFIVFPNWPQWISKLFPTHYFIDPIFRISIYGEGMETIGWEIAVLAALVVISVVPLFPLSRRLEKA